MVGFQHKIQEFATVAELMAIAEEPNNTDKFFCVETNGLYDWSPDSVEEDDADSVIQLTAVLTGRLKKIGAANALDLPSFTAGSDIVQGRAVRLGSNGLVYATDATFDGIGNTGTFGTINSAEIHDVTYVDATNQVLAVGFIANLPQLYVGTVNTATKTIVWDAPVQLSTVGLAVSTKAVIQYDATIGRALVVYVNETTNIPQLVSINRTGVSYAVGFNVALGGGVSSTEVRVTSNGIHFFVSYRSTSSLIAIKQLNVQVSSANIVSTSPNMAGTPSTHAMVWYATDRVAVVGYASGSVFINAWNVVSNAWIGANINVTTLAPNASTPIFDLWSLGGPTFCCAFVGESNSYAIVFTMPSNVSVSNVSTIALAVNGIANPVGVWMPDTNNLFFSGRDSSGNAVTGRVMLSLAVGNNGGLYNYGTSATDGYIVDTEGNYYAIGYNGSVNPKLYYDQIGTQNIETYPIVGIAQSNALLGASLKVAVAGTISAVHTFLSPSVDYSANANGAIAQNGTLQFVGKAISDTKINVSLSEATEPSRYFSADTWAGRPSDTDVREGDVFELIITGVSYRKVTFVGGSWVYDAGPYPYLASLDYSSGYLVIKDSIIYCANAAIAANTVFLEGTTGMTWKQIAAGSTSEYVDGTIAINTNLSLAIDVWTTYATLTIPSDGVWDVMGQMPIKLTAGGVTFRLRKNGAEIWNAGTGDYPVGTALGVEMVTSGLASDQDQRMPVHFWRNLKLSAGDVLTYDVVERNDAGFILGQTANGQFNARKVAGYLPVIGRTLDWCQAQKTTAQSITTGTDITFQSSRFGGTGNVKLNVDNTSFTLSEGEYEILAVAKVNQGAIGVPKEVGISLVDSLNNALDVSQIHAVTIDLNYSVSPQPVVMGILTVTTPITIKLRVTYASAASLLALATMTIKRLGTTDVSQFMGVISNEHNINNTYPSGSIVVKDSKLYQANNNVVAGTLWLTGTAGATWKEIQSKPTKKVVSKITNTSVNGVFYIAEGNLYVSRGSEGNGMWVSGQSNARVASARNGIENAFQIVFPDETGAVVDAGIYNTSAYALFENGNLYTWGVNAYGQLGLGTTSPAFRPTLSTTNVTKVYTHSSQNNRLWDSVRLIIQKTDGKIYGCGYNLQGQLGIGSIVNALSWTEITGAGTFPKSVWNLGGYAGYLFVQKSDNTIWACGWNGNGCVGDGTTTQRTSLVNVSTAWNGGDTTMIIQNIVGGFGYADVSNFDTGNICIFLDNGTASLIRTAGNNFWGTIGNGANANVNITTPVTPTGLSGRINKITRSGDGPGSVHVLKTDGTYWNWGDNVVGQLGRGNTTDSGTPTQLMTGVIDIIPLEAAGVLYGYNSTSPILQKSDGYYITGYNLQGQLGVADATNRNVFTKILLPRDVTIKLMGQMSCDREYVTRIAVTTDNRIFAWGRNANYNIYATDTADVLAPIEVTPKVFL